MQSFSHSFNSECSWAKHTAKIQWHLRFTPIQNNAYVRADVLKTQTVILLALLLLLEILVTYCPRGLYDAHPLVLLTNPANNYFLNLCFGIGLKNTMLKLNRNTLYFVSKGLPGVSQF